MADENGTQDQPRQDHPKTFTQDEVNAIMGNLRREVKGQYADYDELKAKAVKYDEAQEAAKSELEIAQEEAAKARAEAEALRAERAHAQLVAKVSAETGVPASLISGEDEDAMRTSAQAIADYAKATSTVAPQDKGGAATGGKPLSDESIRKMTNPADRVAAYARAYEG